MLCLLSMKFVWLSSEYDDPGQEVVSHEPVEQVEQGKHQREHPPETGKGDLLFYFYVLYSTLLHLPPLRTDSVIEPRTVATGALAVRCSKH